MNDNLETLIAAIIVAAIMGMTGGLNAAENDKDSSGKPGETKTVQGKIVPLYTFLTGQNLEEDWTQYGRQDSPTDRLNRNQPSETRSGRFDTKPSRNQASSNRNADDGLEDRERQRSSRQLSESDQTDPAARENRFGEDAGRSARAGNEWRAMNMNSGQPLALVTSDDRHFEVNKECYLLIFDPADASSERALLQAQRLARISGIYMREDLDESNQGDRINVRGSAEREQDRDRIQSRDKKQLDSPRGRLTDDSRDSNRGTDNSKQDSYESRHDFFESDDSSSASERNASASRSDSTASDLGQEVSVTGCVIEKNGVQAMVVSSISHEPKTGSTRNQR